MSPPAYVSDRRICDGETFQVTERGIPLAYPSSAFKETLIYDLLHDTLLLYPGVRAAREEASLVRHPQDDQGTPVPGPNLERGHSQVVEAVEDIFHGVRLFPDLINTVVSLTTCTSA